MKESHIGKQIALKNTGTAELVHWRPDMADKIYHDLEQVNWASWLAASPETIAGRAKVFPEGQLLMVSPEGVFLASLSTNRITWDGDPANLPTWDNVAGEPTTYESTYDPVGNALVLMSMNVNPDYKSKGFATAMVGQVVEVAKELGIQHLIGSFRPSEYGAFKTKEDNWTVPFSDYVGMQRDDGYPVDAWIRSLTRNGMKPLAVDHHAMSVTIPLQDFPVLISHNPSLWQCVAPGIWECGEVGQWNIDEQKGVAVYTESNLWGEIPIAKDVK